jgi:Secretion system C-terminal sorting domain
MIKDSNQKNVGGKVLSRKIGANEFSLDLSTLSIGVYTIQISTKNGSLLKKFIKE